MQEKQLLDAVLALPIQARARMVREIIASLDEPGDAGADEAWVAEIERRVQEVQDGTVELRDWREVSQSIRSRLGRK